MTTLKGVLRSMEAAAKRADREAKRRQRELDRQQKEIAKLHEFERAEYEVEVYENQIEMLQSFHQDCSDECNWENIKNLDQPVEPTKSNAQENQAQIELNAFKPSFFQKLFGKEEKHRELLKSQVEAGKRKDEEIFQSKLKEYNADLEDWKINISLAKRILEKDVLAYNEAIEKINPFSEISGLGTSLKITFHNENLLEVELNVHSEEVIPKEIKSLLKSGRLSIKSMPKGRFNEIYQDHICSVVIRVAREAFALLPIERVFVNAMGNLLNTKTGYKEDVPILSILIPKDTLDALNFYNIDPSDSMQNFVHNMSFNKTQGFSRVEKLVVEEFV